jgi:hypothetical protein
MTARPQPIFGATWQPGVTRGADGFKVHVNGEPAPRAVAANERQGWVLLSRTIDTDQGEVEGLPIRVYGRVELVPISE